MFERSGASGFAVDGRRSFVVVVILCLQGLMVLIQERVQEFHDRGGVGWSLGRGVVTSPS